MVGSFVCFDKLLISIANKLSERETVKRERDGSKQVDPVGTMFGTGHNTNLSGDALRTGVWTPGMTFSCVCLILQQQICVYTEELMYLGLMR